MMMIVLLCVVGVSSVCGCVGVVLDWDVIVDVVVCDCVDSGCVWLVMCVFVIVVVVLIVVVMCLMLIML